MQVGVPTRDKRAAALFADMPGAESLVLAALEGQGRVLVDSPVHPRCGVAAAGDFLYCGGVPGVEARQLLRRAMGVCQDWLIYAPGAWLDVVRSIAPVKLVTRVAYEQHQPEDGHLRRLLKAMPEGASFQAIEGMWMDWCRQAEWSRDFVSLYSDEDYQQRGLGVLLLVNGEAVAGASSYVSYPGGIEVQLQTRDDSLQPPSRISGTPACFAGKTPFEALRQAESDREIFKRLCKPNEGNYRRVYLRFFGIADTIILILRFYNKCWG